jgi:hypothetical protein
LQNLHWNSFKVKFSVLLFFAVFSSPYYLTAQKCNLEGVAKLADKTDGQVTIQVLDTSGLKLLSFAVTNNSGSYSITSIPKGEAMIRFAQLGYQAKIYRFNCSGSLVTLGPDTLQTLSLDLEEIWTEFKPQWWNAHPRLSGGSFAELHTMMMVLLVPSL